MPDLYQAWGDHLRGESQGSPQQYHQYQQVSHPPSPRQMGSKRNSACHVCGRPSNFLCSACEKVNYCTSRCQVTTIIKRKMQAIHLIIQIDRSYQNIKHYIELFSETELGCSQ